MKVERMFALLGGFSGFLSVGAGAFAAHTLRQKLPSDMIAVFETGARYQMYHALALLGVAWAATEWPGPAMRVSGWCFIAGTILFSGSLYLMAFTESRWLGAITPMGGVAFLVGWLSLTWGALRYEGPVNE